MPNCERCQEDYDNDKVEFASLDAFRGDESGFRAEYISEVMADWHESEGH